MSLPWSRARPPTPTHPPTGADPDPNDPQPNQPFYKLWYESLVCPWDLGVCGDEPLGQNGYEGDGVPTEWAGDRQHPQYIGEDRRAMSCGLCGHLLDVFGKPPHHVADTVPDPLPQGIWEYADGGHMVRPRTSRRRPVPGWNHIGCA